MKLISLLPALAAALALAGPVCAATGEETFLDNCSACHQATGLGIKGAFPALAGDPLVKGAPAPLIRTVLAGRGGMPKFSDQLDDAQLAAVLSYVRGAWGNKAPPVAPADVAAERNRPASKGVAGMQAH